MTPPSVLVVDDGELARLPARLERLSLDFVRVEGPAPDAPLEAPRDLLLTSGRRAMAMPPLSGGAPDAAPMWVCIYDQDFPPLRERLRSLGVHYLVSGGLPPRTFDLFLGQLLHRGRERRRVRRIPLDCAVEIEQGVDRWSASLLELSREGCLFRAPGAPGSALGPGRDVVLRLPPELAGERCPELGGRIVRTPGRDPADAGDGSGECLVVLAFRDLDPDARAALDDIVGGRAPATPVTPLAPEPGPAAERPDTSAEPARAPAAPDGRRRERRRAPRHRYERRTEALCWRGGAGPRVALGRDLSLSGVRLVTSPSPPVGAEVTLALYGGSREEPVVVRGRVVRSEEIETALRFEGLSPGERRGLERLLGGAPQLEDLRGPGEPVRVAEIL